MAKPVAVIAGVGPGNGAALGRAMQREGYACALLARREDVAAEAAAGLADARPYACDVSDGASVTATFARVRAELGPVDVLLFNAGSGVFGSVEEISAADLEAAFAVNVVGLFNCTRAVLGDMKSRAQGCIVVTGATASLRGGARFAAFAPAKAAQRSLTQSLARQLGPQGIHVAIVILDGVVDVPRTRAMMADKPDDFFIAPDTFASAVVGLVKQPRTGWTFELDLRPYAEKW